MAKTKMLATPILTCYPLEATPPRLVPGHTDRDWMDATDKHFAYRCTPLSIANASGWDILTPRPFLASWDGGAEKRNICLVPNEDDLRFVSSHFGHGILTFHTGYLFRTSPGWGLWCRGSPNMTKLGIVPLDGLVETDWLPMPFTMNWRFLFPGTVRFDEGESFCFVTPFPHAILDDVEPVVRSLDDDPELKKSYEAWSERRADFIGRLDVQEKEAVEEGWQRHYLRGAETAKRRLRVPIFK